MYKVLGRRQDGKGLSLKLELLFCDLKHNICDSCFSLAVSFQKGKSGICFPSYEELQISILVHSIAQVVIFHPVYSKWENNRLNEQDQTSGDSLAGESEIPSFLLSSDAILFLGLIPNPPAKPGPFQPFQAPLHRALAFCIHLYGLLFGPTSRLCLMLFAGTGTQKSTCKQTVPFGYGLCCRKVKQRAQETERPHQQGQAVKDRSALEG